jgi:ribosomal peptide maturation radical SAM protein 1
MRMHQNGKNILLVSMPFAVVDIPSIQLALLEAYLKKREINITTKHLYLKATEFYKLPNYNYLINNPNDPYVTQMVFSKYLFPDHWEKNLGKFKEYYDNALNYDDTLKEKISFNKYVEQTDKFYDWVCNQVKWEPYDIIGFTLNYGQFLPSLACSKVIKERYPDKTVVFGGSTTINELGIKVLKTFNWIDLIISGEGEEALFLLASDYDNYKSIPSIIYRKENEVIWNKSEDYIELDNLPTPDFNSFYKELATAPYDVQVFYAAFGRLPIEFSRGCWWNNCTFCNIRAYHKKYREKTVEQFVNELDYLSSKYQMLNFQVIGSTLPQHNYQELCKKIIGLKKSFTLFIEARAGQLNSEDYTLLKSAGFRHIQTGIESFSPHYLKKMNKGASVIDNIAALKYCKENGINNIYNIITDYPNEEKIDFEETKKNIQLFKQYLDPPQTSRLLVGFGSPIYNNCAKFNIDKLEYKNIDKIMYPPEILENNFLFFYTFSRKNPFEGNNWMELVNEWKKEREQRMQKKIKSEKLVDQFIFYYMDGRNFLKIYDKRNGENVLVHILDKLEREVFLSCTDVVSFERLDEKFSNIPEYQLAAMLHTFEKAGIVFQEDSRYLSLPLCYSKVFESSKTEIIKPEFIEVPVS